MIDSNTITLKRLTEEYAKLICNWRYDREYSVYNFSDWETVVENKWGLSIQEKREGEFLGVLVKGELIGYGRIHKKEDKVYIGIGLKPILCGKGYGKDIMRLLIKESKFRFPKETISLEVRSFNKRAINCYKSIGFKIIEEYEKETFSGQDTFYYMEYLGK